MLQKNNDISSLPPSSRDFGIVFQSYALFPNLSVFANIAYGLANNKWSKQDIKQRVDELLELVNLTEHANKYPSHLSGGEQQRVAIARALSNSPKLLLADEPTGNLDPKTAGEIIDVLLKFLMESQVSAIIATHSGQVSERLNRILHLDDGQLIPKLR